MKDYYTYAEAKAAAQVLGIEDINDYRARYRQDPKLPASPDQTYADAGWTDWYDFLGKEKIPAPYATYAEAKAAAQALCIEKRYPDDPRLPASPEKAYADAGWTGWYDFLGKEKRSDPYATYAEAQTAAHALGVKDINDYQARSKHDPRLPATPEKTYADAGWKGWYDFLSK